MEFHYMEVNLLMYILLFISFISVPYFQKGFAKCASRHQSSAMSYSPTGNFIVRICIVNKYLKEAIAQKRSALVNR